MQLQALVVYPLFLVLIMLPSLPLLKRLSLRKDEKLTVGICLSILAFYLISFAVYILGLPQWIFHVLLALCLLVTTWRIRDVLEVFSDSSARESLYLWLLMNLWILLLTTLIQCFSGAAWTGDWIEHYERSRFFSDQLATSAFANLPSRPPLMNLIISPFFAIAGDRFPVFQLVYSQLNTLVVLPMLLLARMLCPGARGLTVPFAVILTCNPMFVQNTTYTWTKLLTVFFILAALYFYLKGWRERQLLTFTFAWVLLTLALLTHYSAGPFFLIFAVHYGVYLLWRREKRWKEFAWSISVSFLLFMTWLGWSLWAYGTSMTFLSNSTVIAASEYNSFENIAKILKNVSNTFLPHFLSGVDISALDQTSSTGFLRDYVFLLYQTNLFFAVGTLGSLFIVLFLLKRDCLMSRPSEEGFFIACLAAVGFVLGIAVHGAPEQFGLMHVCSQAHVMMGLLFVGAQVDLLSRPYRILFAAGLLLDCVLGVLLHVWIQGLPLTMFRELITGFGWNWLLKLTKEVEYAADELQIDTTASWVLIALFCCFVFYRFLSVRTE